MINGLSYGAYAPSLEMQRLMATGRAKANRRARAQALRNSWCLAVLELVHPDNLGPLPPSPDWLVNKALYMCLLTTGEVVQNRFDLR